MDNSCIEMLFMSETEKQKLRDNILPVLSMDCYSTFVQSPLYTVFVEYMLYIKHG